MPSLGRRRIALGLLAVTLLATAGCETRASVTSTAPVATIRVMPASGSLRVGETLQLFADTRDARNRILSGRAVAASSAESSVVTVTPDGLVTAAGPGAAQVVVSSEGQTVTVPVKVAPPAGRVDECTAAKPEWIWCDDFETDRLSAYFEYVSEGESFVPAPGVGYAGSAGMRARFVKTGQVNAGFLHLAFGKTPSPYFRAVDAGTAVYREIYWRIYVRYESGWVGGGGAKMARAQSLVTTNFAQAMIAHLWSGSIHGDPVPVDNLGADPWTGVGFGGRLLTRSYNDFPNLTGLQPGVSKTPLFDRLHVGRWYCIEARARLNDPERGNGVFELWIDDRPEASRTGLSWIGSFRDFGINVVYLENYWNSGAPKPQERYFDNFVVSTKRIGCLGSG